LEATGVKAVHKYIGEIRVRSISLAITFSAGFFASFSYFLAGESISGSFPSIFTSQEVVAGKNFEMGKV